MRMIIREGERERERERERLKVNETMSLKYLKGNKTNHTVHQNAMSF
jgi:hypothetical protein